MFKFNIQKKLLSEILFKISKAFIFSSLFSISIILSTKKKDLMMIMMMAMTMMMVKVMCCSVLTEDSGFAKITIPMCFFPDLSGLKRLLPHRLHLWLEGFGYHWKVAFIHTVACSVNVVRW